MKILTSLPILFAAVLAAPVVSASERTSETRGSVFFEEVLVTGGKENISTLSGSAAFLGEESIAEFDTTDINALLEQVPGVYIRQEDGFGLRPNIGLRGTTSDRSNKITMMEDGILIGPAPYSAPAAYYVPNVNRMNAVEVFKGPSAIAYGPHTVGGAINFVTQPIPEELSGELGLTVGSFGLHKFRGAFGVTGDTLGFAVDGLRYGSDGFKELDGGRDTGFERNDVNIKLGWTSDTHARYTQALRIKLGYADEEADETYLGLTDEDFESNPNRRYATSALDHFNSEHTQLHFLHTLDFDNGWKIISRVYQNNFERSWNKVDGLIVDPFADLGDVINQNASSLNDELALIRADRDSNSIIAASNPDAERIDITDNARKYRSQGVQLNIEREFSLGQWQHNVVSGLRLHNDWIERDHSAGGYLVVEGALEYDGISRGDKALNRGESDALAWFIENKMEFSSWIVNVGVRYEQVDSEFTENAPGKEKQINGSQSQWMPGVGAFFRVTDTWGVLAGVNKGFSPKAASADPELPPEESVNYEYGVRYGGQDVQAEVIGFYSDYSNLLGRCRASETCAGQEFSAGEVESQGLEFMASANLILANDWLVPLSMAYTYSDAKFASSFDSAYSQWGSITEGDFLPYIPRHQAHVKVGLQTPNLALNLALNYIDEMLEASGEGVPLSGEKTEALTTLDFSVNYQFWERLALQLVVNNVSDTQKIVSRRPFGARPNSPRIVKAGITYRF